jgi:hypothetical protein
MVEVLVEYHLQVHCHMFPFGQNEEHLFLHFVMPMSEIEIIQIKKYNDKYNVLSIV